jgi:hypothetical protein
VRGMVGVGEEGRIGGGDRGVSFLSAFPNNYDFNSLHRIELQDPILRRTSTSDSSRSTFKVRGITT